MTDYKNTLNLPYTTFPMKASLPHKEPIQLESWQTINLYKKIRFFSNNKPLFLLHDGPPYANGDIHLGHAINKILKDIIIKSKTLSGFDAPYIPGWDCHGLPIEHQVEKKFGRAGAKIDAKTFRKHCRQYASQQIEKQRESFKRLGVLGEWDQPYLTMDFEYEANILRALIPIIENKHLIRGYKPVFWSVVGQSALAEAEVEYREKNSASIYVRYFIQNKEKILNIFQQNRANISKNIAIIIWTTTPWTLPASQAVALNASVEYALIECQLPSQNIEYFILAKDRITFIMESLSCTTYKIMHTVSGKQLEGETIQHPFYDRALPIILGHHVTVETGTGCVHTAPDHGVDDFQVGLQYNIETLNLIDEAGRYKKNTPLFSGEHVYQVDSKIIDLLEEKKVLLLATTITHSYPHCWRTKTPLIFRATQQWFISMQDNQLLSHCHEALETVQFTPAWGKRRMSSMLSNSPDWCISRQRTWGVPLPFFIHKVNHTLHPNTLNLIKKVAKLVEKQGIDAWFDLDPKTCLPEQDLDHYMKSTDTLDVWFDSGVSHTTVLKHKNFQQIADLYLEGSDQHRGWFQSSLKTSMAMHNSAPYKQLLTHGFTVDEQGHKMSKSQGNTLSPQSIIDQLGADVLRLWAASVDYSTDMAVSKEIFTRISEAYRRMRNTARFLLSNLNGFNPEKDIIQHDHLLSLDSWAIECAHRTQQRILIAYQHYQFSEIYQILHNFCVTDLGGFYLDIIKDRQYTTPANSLARRSCQTALYHITEAFVRWVAPILSFTAEEIWASMPGQRETSVHLTLWYEQLNTMPKNKIPYDQWETLRAVRDCVNKALEMAKKTSNIRSSLAAEIILYAKGSLLNQLQTISQELHFFFITSKADLHCWKEATDEAQTTDIPDLKIIVRASSYEKCTRCWHHQKEIGQNNKHPLLCARCISNIEDIGETRQFI
ncbi:MAG: isoleucine--tRNA ligase [Endozoicomonadaceae bacterium]|nr:isoleucine--tRNA ligase [Endozoicomonadaceae bacterium]